jgi:hypothetical protein
MDAYKRQEFAVWGRTLKKSYGSRKKKVEVKITIPKFLDNILRTIGRYFFPQHAGFDLSSTSTYTRMKLKKFGIPKKNLYKNDDFVYSIP